MGCKVSTFLPFGKEMAVFSWAFRLGDYRFVFSACADVRILSERNGRNYFRSHDRCRIISDLINETLDLVTDVIAFGLTPMSGFNPGAMDEERKDIT